MSIPPIPAGMKHEVIVDVANRLNSLSIHLVRRVSHANYGAGITPARLTLLSAIVFSGPRTVSELARAENVSAPAMTRMLDVLERDGLIRREMGTDDRRTVRVFPTDGGNAAVEVARARRIQHIVDELSILTEEELIILSEAAKLLERVESHSQQHAEVV